MQGFILQSQTLTSIPTSLSPGLVLDNKPSGCVKLLEHSNSTKNRFAANAKLKISNARAQASGEFLPYPTAFYVLLSVCGWLIFIDLF